MAESEHAAQEAVVPEESLLETQLQHEMERMEAIDAETKVNKAPKVQVQPKKQSVKAGKSKQQISEASQAKQSNVKATKTSAPKVALSQAPKKNAQKQAPTRAPPVDFHKMQARLHVDLTSLQTATEDDDDEEDEPHEAPEDDLGVGSILELYVGKRQAVARLQERGYTKKDKAEAVDEDEEAEDIDLLAMFDQKQRKRDEAQKRKALEKQQRAEKEKAAEEKKKVLKAKQQAQEKANTLKVQQLLNRQHKYTAGVVPTNKAEPQLEKDSTLGSTRRLYQVALGIFPAEKKKTAPKKKAPAAPADCRPPFCLPSRSERKKRAKEKAKEAALLKPKMDAADVEYHRQTLDDLVQDLDNEGLDDVAAAEEDEGASEARQLNEATMKQKAQEAKKMAEQKARQAEAKAGGDNQDDDADEEDDEEDDEDAGTLLEKLDAEEKEKEKAKREKLSPVKKVLTRAAELQPSNEEADDEEDEAEEEGDDADEVLDQNKDALDAFHEELGLIQRD